VIYALAYREADRDRPPLIAFRDWLFAETIADAPAQIPATA
jgi:hypothetical protein